MQLPVSSLYFWCKTETSMWREKSFPPSISQNNWNQTASIINSPYGNIHGRILQKHDHFKSHKMINFNKIIHLFWGNISVADSNFHPSVHKKKKKTAFHKTWNIVYESYWQNVWYFLLDNTWSLWTLVWKRAAWRSYKKSFCVLDKIWVWNNMRVSK